MSEVRLVVCEAGGVGGLVEAGAYDPTKGLQWSGIVHGGTADRVIAALGSDPETLEELEIAAARFEKPRRGDRLDLGMSPGLINRSHDAGLVVIDLGARLVVVNSSYSDPQPSGEVRYHNGQFLTGIRLPYHLAPDWLFVSQNSRWTELAEDRRRERASRPRHDLRHLMYGEGLLRFLAEEVWRNGLTAGRTRLVDEADDAEAHDEDEDEDDLDDSDFDGEDENAAAEHDDSPKSAANRAFWRIQRMFARVHAAWLLSPNPLIAGQAPRGLLIRGRRHVGQDIQDRCDAWSLLQRSPPGVPRASAAWQSGPPGDHELILHYDLVRALLNSTWQARQAWLDGNAAALTSEVPTGGAPTAEVSEGDVLTAEILDAEVARLAIFRDTWLDSPHDDLGDRVPRQIIERERSRLPIEMSAKSSTCEPDCPCCQMLSELPGPSFWFLESSYFDEEFAFSLVHETRQDYEDDPYLRPEDEYSISYRGGCDDDEESEDDSDNPWKAGPTAPLKAGAPPDAGPSPPVGGGGHLISLTSSSPGDSTPRTEPDSTPAATASRTGPQSNQRLGGDRLVGELPDAGLIDASLGREEPGLAAEGQSQPVGVAEEEDWLTDPEEQPEGHLPLRVQMLVLTCQLNNLLDALRGPHWNEPPAPEIAERMTRLTHHFNNLVEVVLHEPQFERRMVLVEPVANRLALVIREISDLRPHLSRACGMLERRLETLVTKVLHTKDDPGSPENGSAPGGLMP